MIRYILNVLSKESWLVNSSTNWRIKPNTTTPKSIEENSWLKKFYGPIAIILIKSYIINIFANALSTIPHVLFWVERRVIAFAVAAIINKEFMSWYGKDWTIKLIFKRSFIHLRKEIHLGRSDNQGGWRLEFYWRTFPSCMN